MFLDAGQAQHGYSAIVSVRDVLIAFSRGGETDEVNYVLRIARKRGAKVIGIMEKGGSTMAELSDVVLCARVAPENDAVDVIPLASTLAHAAVGDVLCAAVLTIQGFDDQEFAKLHPGGAVGKRLGSEHVVLVLDTLDTYLRTLVCDLEIAEVVGQHDIDCHRTCVEQ